MRKSLCALLTAVTATGVVCWSACAADQPIQSPASVPTPMAVQPSGAAGAAKGASDPDMDSVKRVLAQWERLLGQPNSEPTKKVLGEAVEKAKELQSTLEKRADAV